MMGKGIITAGGSQGLYTVTLELSREWIAAAIAKMTSGIAELEEKITAIEALIDAKEAEITALAAQIAIYEADKEKYQREYCAALEDMVKLIASRDAYVHQKNMAVLQKTALAARIAYLGRATPADPSVAVWCADLTEDLTGSVGTIEVPGERGAVIIQPGHNGNAAYAAARDGQLQPSIAGDSAAVFYNLAMLPGWQKWKPTYRVGVITALDTDADTCSITLDEALSSAQGLNINQGVSLSNVPITYMTCNASAFVVGDRVVVKFTAQDFSAPTVVGFESNPRGCEKNVFIRLSLGGQLADYGGQVVRMTYYEDGVQKTISHNIMTRGGRNNFASYWTVTGASLTGLADSYFDANKIDKDTNVKFELSRTRYTDTDINNAYDAIAKAIQPVFDYSKVFPNIMFYGYDNPTWIDVDSGDWGGDDYDESGPEYTSRKTTTLYTSAVKTSGSVRDWVTLAVVPVSDVLAATTNIKLQSGTTEVNAVIYDVTGILPIFKAQYITNTSGPSISKSYSIYNPSRCYELALNISCEWYNTALIEGVWWYYWPFSQDLHNSYSGSPFPKISEGGELEWSFSSTYILEKYDATTTPPPVVNEWTTSDTELIEITRIV